LSQWLTNVRFGSKADIAACPHDVRFAPGKRTSSNARRHFCFVPKADVGRPYFRFQIGKLAAERGTLFRRLPPMLKQWCYASFFARFSDDNVIFGYRYPIFVMVERLRNNDDAASRLSVVKRVGAIVN